MNGQHSEPRKRREFRVLPRTVALIGVVLLPLTGALPALSIHELVSTGTIDWGASGTGRRSWPTWLAYPFGWAAFMWGLYFFLPLLRYIRAPLMFALEPEVIEVAETRILRDEVLLIRPRRWQADVLIESKRGNFRVHPGHVADGVAALQEAFPDRFDPLWLTDSGPWLVGR